MSWICLHFWTLYWICPGFLIFGLCFGFVLDFGLCFGFVLDFVLCLHFDFFSDKTFLNRFSAHEITDLKTHTNYLSVKAQSGLSAGELNKIQISNQVDMKSSSCSF